MEEEKESKKAKVVKPLEAKVKPEYFMNSLIAFSGRVYSKLIWNPVPIGQEENARNHEWLEVREYSFKTSEKEREAVNRGEVEEVEAKPLPVKKSEPMFTRTRKDKEE